MVDEPADEPESPDKGSNEPLGVAYPADDASELPVGANAALEFHRRARLAEDRLAEVLAAYRQLKTENDDYRERATRNIERRFEQRRERLLLKFIDILDNLDRALEAAEQSYAGNPLIEGLILVRTQLLQTLQEEGLERIPALGLAFDPAVAESVGSQPVEDPEHHHVVVRELLRGYRLNGRIARPSRVLIGEYSRSPQASPAEEEPLIGADELPELTAEPMAEAAAAAEGEPEPLEELQELDEVTEAAPLQNVEPDAHLEPLLEPLEEDEGRSLEDIIESAQRQDALRETPADEPLPEGSAPEDAVLAEPDASDPTIREAFGVPEEKD